MGNVTTTSEKDFKWLKNEEINNFNINELTDDGSDGYILEVDLDYPKELHDSHNEYPLAPEKSKRRCYHHMLRTF